MVASVMWGSRHMLKGIRVSLVVGGSFLWTMCCGSSMTGVIYSGRAGCSLGLASMTFWLQCMSDHTVKQLCHIGTRVHIGWPINVVRSDNGTWSPTKDVCKQVPAVSGELPLFWQVKWDLTLSVHEWDTCEYQGRLLCAWTAAKVCCNVQVVVHDPQGASKDAQGGSPSYASDYPCEDTQVDFMTVDLTLSW